jgi:hypothetical protein
MRAYSPGKLCGWLPVIQMHLVTNDTFAWDGTFLFDAIPDIPILECPGIEEMPRAFFVFLGGVQLHREAGMDQQEK